MRLRAEIAHIAASHGFDKTADTVYLLNPDNQIVYCNPSWDKFAVSNDGLGALEVHVLGSDVLDVCPHDLRGFYQQLIYQCRATGSAITHGYSCSSPTKARTALMTLRPHGRYVSSQNTILTETVHTEIPRVFDEGYIQGGLLKMCANCRRTFNYRSASWEWVPQLLAAPPANTQHGLCKPCTDFYFGRMQQS